ncbi:hypothetical protein CK228_13615 [Mesorhizobium sp. WSM4312]|uniref:hypothetical protein n=1 Tax=Mesorhizobium sp. WSM4312 TaxID=2029411 RepID=UPI000BAF4C89|nr:hypothetical protein [Mesorhizobium sp. WSM4312]PBB68142.1 hypothetical protein CK228_13615 [Mesorhizobium sp. WSM4312]
MQSDTYAPPPQPAKNENLFRLADALGAFSGTIGNLVGVVGKSSKEDRAREDAAFQMHIAGQTLAQTRKDIADGKMMVTDDKISNAARQSIYGGKWAEGLAADTDAELQTSFDWDNGNPEEFLAKKFQENIEKSGLTDPNALAAAGKAWDGYKTAVLAKQQKYKVDRVNQSNTDSAFTYVNDNATKLIAAGVEPGKVAALLTNERKTLGVKGSLGVNDETLDQEYLNTAARLASTSPEYAVALLDQEYDGRSGKTSLSAQRPYADRVLQIKAEAAKAIGLRQDKAQQDEIDHQADTLLSDGKLDRVTDVTWYDHNHEQKTKPAETIKKEAMNRYLDRSQQIASVNKETPDQTMARELRVSQQSGLDHPGLKAIVTGIAQAASIDMSQNPDAMSRVMDKVKMARWLMNTSKNTYMAYLSEPDRDFMESFMIAKDELPGKDGRQMSDAGALEFATRTSQPVQVDGLNFTKAQNDAIDQSVKSIGTKDGFLGFFTTLTPTNSAAAQQRVASIAKRLVRGGLDQDKAIEVAADSVKRNSITYNGTLLSLGKVALPDNYKEALDGIIGDFATENPGVLKDHDIGAGDISIIPAQDINKSGGRFMLTDKNTGVPLMDDKSGEPYYVTIGTIRSRGNSMKATTDAKAAQDISIRGVAKTRGLVPVQSEDGNGTVWVDPKTREHFDITLPTPGGKPQVKKLGRRAPVDRTKPLYDDNGFMPPLSPRASN